MSRCESTTDCRAGKARQRAARARALFWLPSLLAGVAVAAALATSAGILLYNSRGLTQAGAVLVAVSAISLAAGIWMGSADQEDAVPSAARGWMGFLVALLAGAAFAGLWEFMNGFGGTWAAQGLGLALTAALPSYFAGGVWGRMGGFAESLGSGERLQVLVGGIGGVVAGGAIVLAMLGKPVLAATVFLGAAVLASAGARCLGWIFDRVPQRKPVLCEDGRPELRFESWETAIPRRSVRVLWDGAMERAVDPPLQGDWRAGVAASLEDPDAVLFVGAGSWFAMPEDREWRVFEPDRDVRGLAARGFGWDESVLVDSPIPARPGWTVVAERELAVGMKMDALRDAGVERIWVGGRRSRPPESLCEGARGAGFSVAGYRGAAPGSEGPPIFGPRHDEVWCFGRSPPTTVRGMEAMPPPEGPWAHDGGP